MTAFVLKIDINNSEEVLIRESDNGWIATTKDEIVARSDSSKELLVELEEIYNAKIGEGIRITNESSPSYNNTFWSNDSITGAPSTHTNENYPNIASLKKKASRVWDSIVYYVMDRKNKLDTPIKENEVIDKATPEEIIEAVKAVGNGQPFKDENRDHRPRLYGDEANYSQIDDELKEVVESIITFWEHNRPEDVDKLKEELGEELKLSKTAAVVRPIDFSVDTLKRYANGEITGAPVTAFKWQYVNMKHQICHKCLAMHGRTFQAVDLLGPNLDGISGKYRDVKNARYGASPMYYITHPNCVCNLIPISSRNAKFVDKIPEGITGFSFTQLPIRGSLRSNRPNQVFVREVSHAPRMPGEYYVDYRQGFCVTNLPIEANMSIEYEYEGGQSLYGAQPVTAYRKTITGSLKKDDKFAYIDLQKYIYSRLPYSKRDDVQLMRTIAESVLKECNLYDVNKYKSLVNREVIKTMKLGSKEARSMKKVAAVNEILVDFKKGITDLTERLFNLIRKKSASGVFSKMLESNDRINTMLNYIQALQREALFLPVSDDATQNVATAKTLKKRIVRTANLIEDLGFNDEVDIIDQFLAKETSRHLAGVDSVVKKDRALLLREASLTEKGIMGKNPVLGSIKIDLPRNIYFYDNDGAACYIATAEVSSEHFRKIASVFPKGKTVQVWGQYPNKVFISGYGWGPTRYTDVKQAQVENGYVIKKAFNQTPLDSNSPEFKATLDYSDPMKIMKAPKKEKELKSLYDSDAGKVKQKSTKNDNKEKKMARKLSARMNKQAEYGGISEIYRHCPDHPGIMVMPIAGKSGCVQCPVDGAIYTSKSGTENQTPNLGWQMPSFDYSNLSAD